MWHRYCLTFVGMSEHVMASGDAIQFPSSCLKLFDQLSALHLHLPVWPIGDDGFQVTYHANQKMYLELYFSCLFTGCNAV